MIGRDEERAAEKPARALTAIVLESIEDGLAVLAGAMIVFAMVIVTLDVLLRMFRMSMWWSFEVTEFILVYVPLLSLPWLVRRRAHIVIDIVTSNLPAETARRLEIVTSLLAAAISAFLTYWGVLATFAAYSRGIVNAGMVAYPRWALLIAIPLGFSLAAIEFTRVAYQNWRQAA